MSDKHYQVFLSHSNRDKPFVRQVAERLQREGISFFFDEADLVPGEPWQVALERALGASDSCAVFIGDEGLGPYHTLEMRVALSEQVEADRGFRLIPVLLPGKTRPADRELPAFLKQLTWVEFTADVEKDETAWRRLKAGITGEAPGFVPATKTIASADLAAQRIVPRGLRSFEPKDHEFYLKLVPGSRDKRGLPIVLRDWKQLIERIDPDRTFRVAYWYGPSGCGKSSLVKAGLIPALADFVAPLFVEASADDTEGRILRELRKMAEALPKALGLVDSLRWLVEHPEALSGRKLLLVVDQFEQWLHAAQGPLDGDLAAALRLCDGRRLQCLLLVRDEFKIPVHRLMKSLGIVQRENFNYALIDLLDGDFAREALFEYGRAYQRLPDRTTDLSEPQREFLDRVIAELSDKDGKVVSVQLALLAQMLEGRPWTPATLDQIGGAAGVGRAFFEEKFDKRTASAACQLHRSAAIQVFEALLPETGTIKGRSRSRVELIDASGYAQRPADFDELLTLLDGELRVVTPVMTGEVQGYQLTHDYLVPALHEWLTAKQRETWRGRAFLLLTERTAEWKARAGIRALPGPLEFLRIMAAVLLPTRRLRRPVQK
ncbi:MAG TPA: toll/interleukin-1 receptor domain-containing protein, partial [Pirellulaceae bacterium]|nr:toll/interleukin-1 receptor domain-containing protein [Pirellulaceae bacterium]